MQDFNLKGRNLSLNSLTTDKYWLISTAIGLKIVSLRNSDEDKSLALLHFNK